MKKSIVVLVVLGVMAAVAAAVLTASISARANSQAKSEPITKVLVAAQKIEPMTVLDLKMLLVREVPRKQAPPNAYSDPVQVVGKLVSAPLAEGQAVMPANFAPRGAGLELASQLSPGMRAVAVSLNVPSSLKGLLYPGSVVDVVVSFKLQSNNTALGEAVATTILEKVQILAVDNELVAPPEAAEANGVKKAEKPATTTNQCLVTFKVDSQQAEALQLATEYGKVSLALRNPNDKAPIDKNATLLSQGKLAGMAELLNAMIEAKNKKPEKAPEPAPVAAVKPVPTPRQAASQAFG
ncbi:Flp pilus assembly protein CpaB [bacterium]|nr:Flp pilus assembly protein CpaB [bacterium]